MRGNSNGSRSSRDQASARLHALEDRLRVAAAAERAVHRDVAGRGLKAARALRSTMIGRCEPAGVFPDAQDLLHVRGIARGVQLLYFSWKLRGFLPG